MGFVMVQFEEYSKLIYLDADIQVYENIDHLLTIPDLPGFMNAGRNKAHLFTRK
jgi:alpha-N-acetylglucosamine transferase